MIWLCVLYSVLTIYLLYRNKNKIEIDIFFCLYWVFFISGGVTIYGSKYPIGFKSLMWIISATLVFCLGYRIGKKMGGQRANNRSHNSIIKQEVYTNSLGVLLAVVFLALIAFNIFLLSGKGLFSSSFMNIFSESRRLRYETNTSSGDSYRFVRKVMELIEYPTVAVLGYVFCALDFKHQIALTILLVVQMLSSVLLSGAKSSIIFLLVFFFVGYMVDKFCNNDGIEIKTINYKLVIPVIVLFLLIMKILMSRGESSLLLYAFGEVPAFDYFFNGFNGELTYGKQTFWGLVRLINHNAHFVDIFDNYIIPNEQAIDTNVYTSFRCVITDFGYLGGITFHCLLGLASGIFVNKDKVNAFRMAFFSWILGYICLSFLMSIGYFFTLSISLLFFPIFLIGYNRLGVWISRIRAWFDKSN